MARIFFQSGRSGAVRRHAAAEMRDLLPAVRPEHTACQIADAAGRAATFLAHTLHRPPSQLQPHATVFAALREEASIAWDIARPALAAVSLACKTHCIARPEALTALGVRKDAPVLYLDGSGGIDVTVCAAFQQLSHAATLTHLPPIDEMLEAIETTCVQLVTAGATVLRGTPLAHIEALQRITAARWSGDAMIPVSTIAVVLPHLPTLTARLAPVALATTPTPPAGTLAIPAVDLPFATAKARAVDDFTRAYLEALLAACGGNVSEAARRADLDRSNFRRALRSVGLMERRSDEKPTIDA